MRDSGLRGRGGAGYSTGGKWSTMPLGPDAPHPKYVVCNGDEMEPGSFKDRYLLSRNPHLLIEGMLVAAYAVQADDGFIFLRAQYDEPYASVERALAEAAAAGYLGEHILGSDFSFELFLHESVGRYICGEASAMLNALESQRPNPRARPPHMTGAGLYARPTVVNNVETLCAVPSHRAQRRRLVEGTVESTAEGGTKIYGVAGRVQRPGCVELPMGTSMRELIDVHAGGMQPGFELRAVSPGGASTAFVPADQIDVAMDFSAVATVQSRMGTGTMVAARRPYVPGGHDAQHAAVLRAGVVRLVHAVPRGPASGRRTCCARSRKAAARARTSTSLPSTCGSWAADKTFCDLAPGAMQPLEAALRLFRDDFVAHIESGRCPYAAAEADESAGGGEPAGPEGDAG